MLAQSQTGIGGSGTVKFDFHADPILGPAYQYWQAKCGTRAMPRRRDIDPIEFPRLLPYVQLTELVGQRIRYRLVGTAIVDNYGGELCAKYFDEVFSGQRLRFIEANYRMMCERRQPVLVCNRYFSRRSTPLICVRLVMPLSEDGATVDRCFTAMNFQHPGDASQWFGDCLAGGTDDNVDFANCYAVPVDGDSERHASAA